MKRFAILGVMLLSTACLAPWARAQGTPNDSTSNREHGNVGAFFDFTRQQDSSFNMLGVGGRVGFNVSRNVVLEAEMAYDFERTKTQTVTTGSITNTTRTSLRLLHAEFGPKFQTTGPVRLFVFAKGGILNFGVGGPVTAGTISSQIGGIPDGDTKGVMYPGGGVEIGHALSFRAEVGDEIFFAHGTHNNIRVTVGPQLRF